MKGAARFARQADIAALAAQDLEPEAIAERLGLSRSAVVNLLGPAQRRDDTYLAKLEGILFAGQADEIEPRITDGRPVRVLQLLVPEPVFAALIERARQARKTPSTLLRGLLEAHLETR